MKFKGFKETVIPISFSNKLNEISQNRIANGIKATYDSERGSDDITTSETPDRGKWGSKWEFVLSCVGLSVGIGNVWRFPYLAYENGGGAFLLPYFILMILVGKPMYFMELSLGQFTSRGPLSVWGCFPIAKGIGAAMVVVSLIVAIYYNVIMAYTLFYIAESFRSVVPWSGCYDWWGADNETCYVRSRHQVQCAGLNVTDVRYENCTNATQTASEQFWKKYVLELTPGPEELGGMRTELAVCLLVSWIIVFLCLMKGVKSSGKVVYFTATFPYVLLLALLIFGATLDGAVDGIKYLFIPEWKKLLDINVWRAAAEQLFFSLSISWGGLIMFGSYNKFNNKVHRDALFVSSLDFLTSLIAGIVIFSVLGSMSKEMGVPIANVTMKGQGLAFVAYPEALARLNVVPQLWSVLFFFMLFLLGMDSEFALLETFLTALYDELPKTRKYKVLITLATCSVCFLLGLPCVMQGGQYILNLMDEYGGGQSVLMIAVCEMAAIMWGYGVRNFASDIEFMLGFRPGIFWQICWAVISPLVLAVIFIYSLIEHVPISYNDIDYPDWGDGVGWLLVAIVLLQIPIWGTVILLRKGKAAFFPNSAWGAGDPEAREARLRLQQSKLAMADSRNGIDNPTLDYYRQDVSTTTIR